ncbi:MAG: hypothetical protein J2P46_07735 [Zavarzinella sp.]|nr:hypothetical protein [Zavarzinella sp.]
MTSERQRLANRRNALKSTGPKTVAGKALMRLNAVRHGLRGAPVVVPGLEAPADWERFRADMVSSLSPVGPLEETLAERAAGLLWRLRRVERFESLSVAADQVALEIPARPRSTESAIDQLLDEDEDRMTDEEFLADREASVADARATVEKYCPARDFATGLSDLGDEAPVDPAGTLAFLAACSDHAEDEGADDTLSDIEDEEGLRQIAGLAPGPGAAWTAGAVRKVLGAFAAATKKKQAPARFLKAVLGSLDYWIKDAETEIELHAPEADALRQRIVLSGAVARARRAGVGDAAAGHIARYEGHLQRQLSATLSELARLQQGRVATPKP